MADLAAEIRGGAPSSDILERLAALVGARNVLTDTQTVEPYLTEERGLYRGRTRAVVRPGSAAEVAALTLKVS